MLLHGGPVGLRLKSVPFRSLGSGNTGPRRTSVLRYDRFFGNKIRNGQHENLYSLHRTVREYARHYDDFSNLSFKNVLFLTRQYSKVWPPYRKRGKNSSNFERFLVEFWLISQEDEVPFWLPHAGNSRFGFKDCCEVR
jgi:hypothetical protein